VRRFALTTFLAFALPWLAPRSLLAQLPDTRERAAVQRLIVSYADSLQAGKLAAVEAMFLVDPNLHIVTGSAALHSWAEYRDQVLKPEMQRFTGLRYTHSGIEIVVKGDVAWCNFRWQMAGSSDKPEPVLGRATAVLLKVNGEWKITTLHLSQ
jgi:ketosteroid isomerase-like protein